MIAIVTIADWLTWLHQGLHMEAAGPTLTWDASNNMQVYRTAMLFLFSLISHLWLQRHNCLGGPRC